MGLIENRVAWVHAPDYAYDTVRAAVRRQMDLLQAQCFIRPGARVLLKPNLLMKRSPEQFTTTHPMLVRCVAESAWELGAGEVVIADSPGGPYTLSALQGIYRASGMLEAAASSGAVLNESTEYGHRACREYRVCSSFNLIQPVLDADVLINLPKVKTHCMTTLSGGVKNLFGCVPGLQKPELHCRFSEEAPFCEMLVDLACAVAPTLTIADGIVCMQGDGPSGGSAYQAGFLAGSRSAFALDAALAGYLDLPMVSTERLACARGVGPTRQEVVQLGDVLEPLHGFKAPKSKEISFLDHVPGFLRPIADKALHRVAKPQPRIHSKACIGCGKCRESCPVQTIVMTGHKARIEEQSCIRCYCCHEMCPVGAVRIKRLGLFNL